MRAHIRSAFAFALASSLATQGCSTVTSERAAKGAPEQPYVAHESAPSIEAAAPAALGAPPPPVAQSARAPSGAAPSAVAPQPAHLARKDEARESEQYADYGVNPVTDPRVDKLSTFAIDVDTASYAIARRKLNEGALPPFASVRAEEFLNSFHYGYAAPERGPLAVQIDAAPSPFTRGHHLVRVGLQAKRVARENRVPVHLTYLVDVSGSMMGEDRIELAKKSLRMLTESLDARDTVALCTYAGAVREVLPPTSAQDRARVFAAIDDLNANGSTAMSSGIELAYRLATRTQVKGHVNRVVVLSDGDANVGNTTHDAILKTIAHYKSEGITLSTVGFGSGNYKDTMMEQLADRGDGNYSYIDSEAQARRVFSEQVGGLLQVVARDVKVQVEFDPNAVASYRLIGYENRDLADKDFRNDKVDAGEVGSGHAVTAMYDVVFRSDDAPAASPVRVRVRHKEPLGTAPAVESVFALKPASVAPRFEAASADFRFATAVAGFAEVLRKSPHAAEWRFDDIAHIAQSATDREAERVEFVSIVKKAEQLSSGGRVSSLAK